MTAAETPEALCDVARVAEALAAQLVCGRASPGYVAEKVAWMTTQLAQVQATGAGVANGRTP